MPDQFKTVTTTGYGSRIMNSIKGILFGVVLFIASFGVLYWNEGRVDVSLVAKNAVQVDSANVDATLDGKFVSTTGEVISEEKLGDDLYLVAGNYIAVRRTVEMYSWVEKSESKSTTNTGGSETTETTYNYVKEWTENPMDSSKFQYPADHSNPVKSIQSADKTVNSAKVGVYDIDMTKITLPELTKLTLNKDNILPTVLILDSNTMDQVPNIAVGTSVPPVNSSVLSYGYVFVGKGNVSMPQIGDLRVSYSVLNKATNVTVFGKVEGTKLTTYVDDKEDVSLYRMFAGTRDEAIKQMHTEYVTMTWILRLVGFLMMWFGLSMLIAPLSVLLDVLPFLGSLSRSLVGIITFIVALVLSLVTIFVSMIIHNIVALVIAIIVIVLLFIFIWKKKGAKLKAGGAV